MPGRKQSENGLKRVLAGNMDGCWDVKRRCLSVDLPTGITRIKLTLEGIDGVHSMSFSTFECAGSFITWEDYDYPCASREFMIARELMKNR